MSADGYDIVVPGAAAMIETLRAYGYSLNTAIADLVDNSISAHARNVWIRMHWAGDQSWITIIDDGHGMEEKVLVNAMRPGSQNPLKERDEKDLGRFGLGMKTASFSQCRSLTVASKVAGGTNSLRRWDLDYVGKHNEWRLLRDARVGAKDIQSELDDLDHGTVLLLEGLDRLCAGQNKMNTKHRDTFFSLIDSLSKHLSMIFHRFLSGPKPLCVYLNGKGEEHRLRAWDPFLEDYVSTTKQPEESKSFHGGSVKVQGFVLPHKDRFKSTEEHQAAGGPGGWNDQQGFYIYRNKRLLVPGSWLGIGGRRHGWTKEEHYKLARIRVDIPNAMDSEWQIDVKKSGAIPPALVRSWLNTYATETRKKAREVFSHRGAYGPRKKQDEVARLWKQGTRGGAIVYKIDRNHELVKSLKCDTTDTAKKLDSLLSLIEETVPVQQIWLDMAEKPEQAGAPLVGMNEKEVISLVEKTLEVLAGPGRKPTRDLIDSVCRMDAFLAYEPLIRAKFLGNK